MSGSNGVIDNEGVQAVSVPDCPLCGQPGRVLYEELRDRYFEAPGVWSFLRCSSCGHVWLDPRPQPWELMKLYPSYANHYAATFRQSASERGTSAAAQRRTDRAILAALGYPSATRTRMDLLLGKIVLSVAPVREILEGNVLSLWGPPRGRLLDVGCGAGMFLEQMRSVGWQVEGLEFDPSAARIARDRRGLTVSEGTLGEAAFPRESFDAITMSHVIEHLVDPMTELANARSWLKPGGRLVIRTPNAESLGHARFGAHWMPLEPPRHIHLFTSRTLERCVERAGFDVVGVHTSARIAQGVFDSSRAIRDTGHGPPPAARINRSLGARVFIVREMLACERGRDVGEEVVLTGTRGAVPLA